MYVLKTLFDASFVKSSVFNFSIICSYHTCRKITAYPGGGPKLFSTKQVYSYWITNNTDSDTYIVTPNKFNECGV